MSGTHQIASYSTEDVNDTDPKPSNGALYLDAHIELNRHDDDKMDDAQVHKDGCEEAPELLRVRGERIWNPLLIVQLTHKQLIEATYGPEAVHLHTHTTHTVTDRIHGGTAILID